MIHEAFATDPTPDLPLNVGFGLLADVHLGRCDVRLAPSIRHFQFAVSAMFFPVWNKKFPVPIAGNSSKEVPCFSVFSERGGPFCSKFPVFSRRSGNFK
jgi:hypothetical protein